MDYFMNLVVITTMNYGHDSGPIKVITEPNPPEKVFSSLYPVNFLHININIK